MANDVRILMDLLADYHAALGNQRLRVAQSHQELEGRFQALAAVYEGTSFHAFEAGWRLTGEAFDAYIEGVPPLLDLLGGKLEELRRLDGGQ